jgi:outer membrane protein assembly factor BamB
MAADLVPPLRLQGVWPVSSGRGKLSTPAIANDVAVAVGPTRVVAFDPSSGARRWSLARSEGEVLGPAIDTATGTVVFVEGKVARQSALVGVDLLTGSRSWRVGLGGVAGSAPSILRGHVYVGARDQFLYDVDIATRAVAKVRTAGVVESAPAGEGGRVFAIGVDRVTGKSRLYSVDTATHRRPWVFSPGSVSFNDSSPTVVGGTVYSGFGDSYVRAFDAGTGAVRWAEPVRSGFSELSSPAYANGSLYVLDQLGGLYRLDARTGRRIWDFQFSSFSIGGAPLVVGHTVYVGLDDGSVAAVDVGSGHLVWRTRLRFGPIGALAPAGSLLLASATGPRGGTAAFRTDPNGALSDITSPTKLNLPRALVNFGAAFALVLLVVMALFRTLARRRPEGPPNPVGPAASGGPLGEG